MFGSALDWVNDLVCWFGQWIPRWGICPITHRGVKTKGHFLRGLFGSQRVTIKEIRPGVYFHWPVKTTVELMQVRPHDIDLSSQSLTTRDNKSVTISMVFLVRISSVVNACTKTPDVDSMIRNLGGVAATHAVASRKWCEFLRDLRSGKLYTEVQETAQELLRPYGVRVLTVRFGDFSKSTVYRVIGGSGTVPVETEDEDDDE